MIRGIFVHPALRYAARSAGRCAAARKLSRTNAQQEWLSSDLAPSLNCRQSTHVTVRSVKVTCREEEPTCLAVMYDARQTADMAGDDQDAGSQRFERSHRQSLGARRHHEQTERRPVRREVRDEAVNVTT